MYQTQRQNFKQLWHDSSLNSINFLVVIKYVEVKIYHSTFLYTIFFERALFTTWNILSETGNVSFWFYETGHYKTNEKTFMINVVKVLKDFFWVKSKV